jgi:hypothetical protein
MRHGLGVISGSSAKSPCMRPKPGKLRQHTPASIPRPATSALYTSVTHYLGSRAAQNLCTTATVLRTSSRIRAAAYATTAPGQAVRDTTEYHSNKRKRPFTCTGGKSHTVRQRLHTTPAGAGGVHGKSAAAAAVPHTRGRPAPRHNTRLRCAAHTLTFAGGAALQIFTKAGPLSEAPPTRKPSISSCRPISAQFESFTEPP